MAKWGIKILEDRFSDNSGVVYHETEVKIKRRVGEVWLYPQFGRYWIDEKGQTGSDSWVGIGVEGDGWGLQLRRKGVKGTYQFGNYQLSFTQEPLVYSRRSYCSISHKTRKVELSYYSESNGTALWWSTAIERIDDGNWVFTPQFDWDLAQFRPVTRLTLTPNLSGWYQFNSRPSTCYYSPHSTDSTMVHLKWNYNLTSQLKLEGKIGAGWSFHDSIVLRDSALYLTYPKLGLKVGCEWDKSNSRNGTPYRSKECLFQIVKEW
jgi:hypothetical protein